MGLFMVTPLINASHPRPTMPQKGTGSPYKNGSRYWGDFRSYIDVGGDREHLIARGEKLAPKDPAVARE